MFPRRAPEASAAFRESATWGSDVELEAMESEHTGLVLSLPLSHKHVRASSPVEYGYLYPSHGPQTLIPSLPAEFQETNRYCQSPHH